MSIAESCTILLVDDDDAVRAFLAMSLTVAGFKVVQANSGPAAIQAFNELEEVHLVLTDMVMPGLFGDQMALRLWDSRPDLPIIFISGNAPEALESEVVLDEGRNFLRKPFSIEDLKRVIAGICPIDSH
jgi:CheY-like chemotaxis protein